MIKIPLAPPLAPPISSTNRYIMPAVANALSAFVLPQFGIIYLYTIVKASSVNSFKTLVHANLLSLFTEAPM